MMKSGTPSAWLTRMIISSDWMTLTWGVEQPPGDCRVRPATGQATECHITALVHCDVFWHLVDVGWNWRQKRNGIRVNSTAIIHERKEQSVFCLRKNGIDVNLESTSVYSVFVKHESLEETFHETLYTLNTNLPQQLLCSQNVLRHLFIGNEHRLNVKASWPWFSQWEKEELELEKLWRTFLSAPSGTYSKLSQPWIPNKQFNLLPRDLSSWKQIASHVIREPTRRLAPILGFRHALSEE